ncbi:hypothetical protein TorRG33x02_174810 [Trema orientale]|uniref:Uncharacterized protein n=1 Tax=Trema orientale TaxID=63057 RepID=A0A2P5EMF4_TREOI|nr:hypothetical protein TorRG33x02_174810 [Trema orientale]
MELIWKARNEAVHLNIIPSLNQLINSIKSSSASLVSAFSSPTTIPTTNIWKPPPEDWLKIHFDDAIKPGATIGSADLIIRISAYTYIPSSALVRMLSSTSSNQPCYII